MCNGIAVKEGDYFKKDGLSKYDSATEKKHKDCLIKCCVLLTLAVAVSLTEMG